MRKLGRVAGMMALSANYCKEMNSTPVMRQPVSRIPSRYCTHSSTNSGLSKGLPQDRLFNSAVVQSSKCSMVCSGRASRLRVTTNVHCRILQLSRSQARQTGSLMQPYVRACPTMKQSVFLQTFAQRRVSQSCDRTWRQESTSTLSTLLTSQSTSLSTLRWLVGW